MTYFGLKCVACVTMLMDHLSLVYPVYFDWLDALCVGTYRVPFFRVLGRISFPIFAFLIANGLKYTRDVKKYALRLLVLACISEIPFNLMVRGKVISFGNANVVFTLLIGLISLALHRTYKGKHRFGSLLSAVFLLIGCVAAICLGADYSYIGVLTVFLFGVFDGNGRFDKGVLFILLFLLFCWKSVAASVGGWLADICGVDILQLPVLREVFLGDIWPLWVRLFSLVSLIPIFLYRGEKGLSWVGPRVRYGIGCFMNAFYPLHMLLIDLLFIV